MGSVEKKMGSGHIKAISNKNLSILEGLKSKFPPISAAKLAEKFKKKRKIYLTGQTIRNYFWELRFKACSPVQNHSCQKSISTADLIFVRDEIMNQLTSRRK